MSVLNGESNVGNPWAFARTNGVHALDMSRHWRSLKYECVYLHAWEADWQAKAGVGRWISLHNHRRLHAAHGGQPCHLASRCIDLPKAMAGRSPTSLQPKPIRIGARVVRLARATTFQLAEVAVAGTMVMAILAAIRRLRAPRSCS